MSTNSPNITATIIFNTSTDYEAYVPPIIVWNWNRHSYQYITAQFKLEAADSQTQKAIDDGYLILSSTPDMIYAVDYDTTNTQLQKIEVGSNAPETINLVFRMTYHHIEPYEIKHTVHFEVINHYDIVARLYTEESSTSVTTIGSTGATIQNFPEVTLKKIIPLPWQNDEYVKIEFSTTDQSTLSAVNSGYITSSVSIPYYLEYNANDLVSDEINVGMHDLTIGAEAPTDIYFTLQIVDSRLYNQFRYQYVNSADLPSGFLNMGEYYYINYSINILQPAGVLSVVPDENGFISSDQFLLKENFEEPFNIMVGYPPRTSAATEFESYISLLGLSVMINDKKYTFTSQYTDGGLFELSVNITAEDNYIRVEFYTNNLLDMINKFKLIYPKISASNLLLNFGGYNDIYFILENFNLIY